MGGGDLNLKKSWHPNTMKNQERVWKAEQADAAEKNKLAELQREISDERAREELKRIGQTSGVLAAPDSNKKLEWMYKTSGELLNREEYLLGRTVDRNFERVEAEEKEALVGVQVHKNHVEHECIPFSIRSYHGIQMSDEQVDLQRKIMEDPLMAIRQREMETRKKLLENPVKLKEIHRLLRSDSDLGKSKRGKDKKSSKKKKKDKKSKKSSKDDLDEMLAKKYRKIRNETLDDQDDGNVDIDKFLAMKYHQLSNELDKMGGKTGKSKKKSSKADTERGERQRDRDERDRNTDDRNLRMDRKPRNDDNRHQRNNSRSPQHSRQRQHSPVQRNRRSKSRSPQHRRDRQHSSAQRNNRSRSRSPQHRRERKQSPVQRNRSRSVSTSRKDGNAYNRQRDDRFNRDRIRRSPSYDRVDRNKRQRSPDRSERSKRSASKDRNRNRDSRRQASQDRDRHGRRSRSVDRYRRNRRSPSKERTKPSKSRSRSPDTKRKNQSSTSRQKSRSKSTNDERPSDRIPKVAPHTAKSARSSSSDSSSSSSSSSSSNGSADSDRPKMVYGLVSADGKKIEIKNKYQPTEKRESEKVTKKVVPAKPIRMALTEEEKKQKLMEMQEDARMRVIECQQIMERNKKEKMAEETQLSQTFDKEYVNKEMRKAIANQFTVESRIKSNLNNIQRSGRTMEANFAKR